jgi:16S rRNA (cytosine967-C5)-methyltransferase
VTRAARPGAARSGAAVAPARAVAFAVIRRVFEQGAFADRALHAEAAELDGRDRALAMALAYGAVQRRATLDHIAARLSARSLDTLDVPVLAALRLGLLQLLFFGGAPEHAVVNDSVELSKAAGGGGATLVNAVLRRATAEGAGLLAELGDDTPERAAVLHSVPAWVAALWWDELGSDRARSLLRAVNEPAESALRVNSLRATRAGVIAELPVAAVTPAWPEDALVTTGPFDAHASALFTAGAIMPQSRASQLVSRVLAPRPGDRTLDLCAAPGAKTTHLAALMAAEGRLDAVERNAQRAEGLRRTCRRMGAGFATVHTGDAAAFEPPAPCDRVLVDPPCSGLGTLQSRPDLRWRATPERLAETAVLQHRILAAGAAVTAPGGILVYSVCTVSRAEGSAVVGRFLDERRGDWEADMLADEHPDLADAGDRRFLQLLPDRDGTDGFFIARLRRR